MIVDDSCLNKHLIYIFPLKVTNKLQSWFSINSYIKGYWANGSSTIKKGWCSVPLQWPISCTSAPTKEKCQRNRGPRYIMCVCVCACVRACASACVCMCVINTLCLSWSTIQYQHTTPFLILKVLCVACDKKRTMKRSDVDVQMPVLVALYS
jgi:hypothetical protein